MSEQEIPKFGKAHDPDNTSSRNFDIGWVLRRLNGSFNNASVTVNGAEWETPAAEGVTPPPIEPLVISGIAYDPTEQKVSFRIAGGSVGAKYLITLRIFLTDGRSEDASAWQLVRNR